MSTDEAIAGGLNALSGMCAPRMVCAYCQGERIGSLACSCGSVMFVDANAELRAAMIGGATRCLGSPLGAKRLSDLEYLASVPL